MIRSSRPAVDRRITPAFGTTRDGQPLSYNRPPAPDIAPWVARVSVTRLKMAPEDTLECGLFTDSATVRIQIAGGFEVKTRDGWESHQRSSVFCGPLSRLMPVRITGEFVTVALTIRPSACFLVRGEPMSHYLDRVTPTRFRASDEVLQLLEDDGSPEEWLDAVENIARAHIAHLKGAMPEPITAHFEEIAFLDPTMSIAQAAREIGVDRRRLERLVVRDFGMPPKQVLKRARALDMASYLRGVADDDEGEALALRYYDESHLIREFIELFGMSPRQFIAQPQPLLTLTLESRQARRLEMLNRLPAGAKRPWE